MSSRKVNNIDAGAIVSANDLRTGRTVYFTDSGDWSLELAQAVVLTNGVDAESKLARARAHVDAIGATLINTTEQGQPLHIREIIRVLGPGTNSDVASVAQAAGA